MTALIRNLFNSSFKHKKLSEEWGWKKKYVQDTEMQERNFLCKSLGSTLVSDPANTRLKEEAIKMIVLSTKTSGREPEKVQLDISAEELKILTPDGKDVIKKVSIFDISYCMADSHYDRVFAIYVATEGGDVMNECHAFLCPSAKAARFVALSISEAFLCAYTQWIAKGYDERSLPGAQAIDKTLCDIGSASEPDLSKKHNGIQSQAAASLSAKSSYRQTMSKTGKKVMDAWNSSHTNSLFSFESEAAEFSCKADQRNSLSLDGEPPHADTLSVSSWDQQFSDSSSAQKSSTLEDVSFKPLQNISSSPPFKGQNPWSGGSFSSTSSFSKKPPRIFSPWPQVATYKNSKDRWTVFDDS